MTDPTPQPAMEMLNKAMSQPVITTDDAVMLTGDRESVDEQIRELIGQNSTRVTAIDEQFDRTSESDSVIIGIDCFLADITDAEWIPGPRHEGYYYLGRSREIEVIAMVRPHRSIQVIKGRQYMKFSIEHANAPGEYRLVPREMDHE